MSTSAPAFRYLPQIVASLALFIAGLLALFPPIAWPASTTLAAALVAATIGLWASGLLSEALTALLFFGAAIVLRIAPPEIVLSGLGSLAFWMIFSGLVIAAAIKNSGLSERIAGVLARPLARRPSMALAGPAVFGLCLAFVVPSAMGRVALIIPVLQDLARRLGYPAGSKAARGIMLGGILGTSLPSTAILPANIPNNVLAGMFEKLFHRPMSYGAYLLEHFPVFGLLKTLLLIGLLIVFYRDGTRLEISELPAPKPWTKPQRRVLSILALAFILWASDSLHGISPAWIGLGAAIACLAPAADILEPRSLQKINTEPLFYVAAVVGMGTLISHSGLGARLGQVIQDHSHMADGKGLRNFMVLCGISTIAGLLTTLPGLPAVMTPLTADLSVASGLSQPLVLASQVAGFSTLLLPYQAPPLVLALQMNAVPRWETTRICLIVAILSIGMLWPLDYYWQLLLPGE